MCNQLSVTNNSRYRLTSYDKASQSLGEIVRKTTIIRHQVGRT